MTAEELLQATRRLTERWDNLRIVGQGWSGDARRGFQFNPIRTSSVTATTPPVVTCPSVEEVTVTFSGISFDCGCLEYPDLGVSVEGVDGDPFDPMAPGVNDTFVLALDVVPDRWIVDAFLRFAVYNWDNPTCFGDATGIDLSASVVGAFCNPVLAPPGWVVSFNGSSGYAPFYAEGILDPTIPFANQLVCNTAGGEYSNIGIATGGTAVLSW